MELKNKIVVVTGGASGIGKAMALGFAREGADVVIAARTEVQKDERLPGTIHSVAEEVRALGRRALPVKVNVAKEEDVDRMIAQVRQLHRKGVSGVQVNYYPDEDRDWALDREMLEAPLAERSLRFRETIAGLRSEKI